MAKSWKKKLIEFAAESTYNVDAIAAGATPTPIYAKNVTFQTGQGDTEQPEYEVPYHGVRKTTFLDHRATLSFEVEIPNAGTAGTADPISHLINLCWMDLTEDAGPPPVVTHSLVDTGQLSGTFYFRIDDERHALTGVIASQMEIRFERKKRPLIAFQFAGTHLAPVKEALPSADFSAWKKGVIVSETNTPVFQIDGFGPCTESITVTLAAQLDERDLINCNRVSLTSREVTGSIKIDAPDIVTEKDYWDLARQEVGKTLQLVHGPAGSHQFQLDAPAVQILEPSPGDSAGTYSQDIALNFLPVAGNDDISLTFKG